MFPFPYRNLPMGTFTYWAFIGLWPNNNPWLCCLLQHNPRVSTCPLRSSNLLAHIYLPTSKNHQLCRPLQHSSQTRVRMLHADTFQTFIHLQCPLQALGVGIVGLSLQTGVHPLSACNHRSGPHPLHLCHPPLVQVCSSSFQVFTRKLGTYSHRATTHLLHPHGHRFNRPPCPHNHRFDPRPL